MEKTEITGLLYEARENFRSSFKGKKPPASWRERPELKPYLDKVSKLNLSPAQKRVVNVNAG